MNERARLLIDGSRKGKEMGREAYEMGKGVAFKQYFAENYNNIAFNPKSQKFMVEPTSSILSFILPCDHILSKENIKKIQNVENSSPIDPKPRILAPRLLNRNGPVDDWHCDSQ